MLLAGARAKYDEVAATGWAEVPRELPAQWVEDHIARMGGWRLAPPLLVDQLAALEPPAPLVMVPRRQRKKLNGQLDFLGEPPESSSIPTTAPPRASRMANRLPSAARTAN